jgi:hypothetical protein
MNNYQQIKDFADEASKSFAEAIDNEVAWGFAELIKKQTTKYLGRGRPKETDYDIYKHPFSGELRKLK